MNAPPPKTRLDLLLVERGLATTRSKARDAIVRGSVLVDGAPVTKPGSASRRHRLH